MDNFTTGEEEVAAACRAIRSGYLSKFEVDEFSIHHSLLMEDRKFSNLRDCGLIIMSAIILSL